MGRGRGGGGGGRKLPTWQLERGVCLRLSLLPGATMLPRWEPLGASPPGMCQFLHHLGLDLGSHDVFYFFGDKGKPRKHGKQRPVLQASFLPSPPPFPESTGAKGMRVN